MRSAAPADRLAGLIRNWMARLQSFRPVLNIFEYEFRLLSSERRSEIVSLRARIAQVPQEIISAGIRDGSFSPSADPYVVTATLLRILNSTVQGYRPDRGVEWEDVTEWYVRLTLGGLHSGQKHPLPPSLAGQVVAGP
jgi:hypothetical protein